ncbi:MAG TPA: RNA pseudouridine synthase [Spirochaetota bacterium]|nr:RNA pseudouridine synthase [Spirochaetota bacterium]HOL57874.1 RNA pseudouridine synthase [Spirochaetota bacterium]HPP03911.1 RNA pseudouridine synthase [Spirochaetota bacterium]
MNYKVIYEDNNLLIFNKPQGLPTGIGNQNNNLVSLVFKDYPFLKEVKGYNEKEGGLLNRLDNETGGLVLFAKNNAAFEYYEKQMKNEKIKKIYTAIVEGVLKKKKGIIDYPIIHNPKSKKRMKIIKEIKENLKIQKAKTEYEVIKEFKKHSILKVIIYKGKRHQIRIHLASIGHPIIGDKLYGNKQSIFKNHFLYATGLEFITPLGEKKIIEIKPFFEEYDKIKLLF